MKRETTIDVLRGAAVVLMVASHATWFFAKDDIAFWHLARQLGDAVCFITFLFTFGVGQYFALFAKDDPLVTKKSLLRTLNILIAYYIAAFVSLLPEIQKGNFNFDLVWKTLLFINVPGFTEYLIPFVVFSLIFILIKKFKLFDQVLRLKNYLFVFYIIGTMLFVVGTGLAEFVNGLVLPDAIKAYASIFFSHQDVYLRYPVLQYSIVPLLGIAVGKMIKEKDSIIVTKKAVISLFVGTSLTLGLYLTSLFANFDWLNVYNRFPPSYLFILQNLSVMTLIFLFIRWTTDFPFWKPLQSYGTHSLGIMVAHVVLLRIFEYFGLHKTDNFWLLLLYFLMALHVLYLYVLPKSYLNLRKNNE